MAKRRKFNLDEKLFNHYFGKFITGRRTEMELTQKEAAKRFGLTEYKLSRLERGEGLLFPAEIFHIMREIKANSDEIGTYIANNISKQDAL